MWTSPPLVSSGTDPKNKSKQQIAHQIAAGGACQLGNAGDRSVQNVLRDALGILIGVSAESSPSLHTCITGQIRLLPTAGL